LKELKNILIIGTDGLIGSHLLQKLASSNYNVFGTSRNSKSISIKIFYLDLLLDNLDLPDIIFDTVIITAGVTKTIYFKKNLQLCKKINVDNTIKLISKKLVLILFFYHRALSLTDLGHLMTLMSQQAQKIIMEFSKCKLKIFYFLRFTILQ
jgi:hypothetical protein